MRNDNYDRQRHDDQEPELQWLEDSVNFLANLTFLCVREIMLVAANFVTSLVHAYKNPHR